jgi:membrane protein implicated in regulation of membrane protease activity
MDAITAYLDGSSHWTWWILALLLFLLELTLPGVFFLWLGIAAAITGLVALVVVDLSWQLAVTIFTVLSVATAMAGRRFWRPRNIETSDPTLNQRGVQYIGHVFTLESAIEDGNGRMKVADSSWLVSGPDMSAGTKVRVTGVNGAKLTVERADPGPAAPSPT